MSAFPNRPFPSLQNGLPSRFSSVGTLTCTSGTYSIPCAVVIIRAGICTLHSRLPCRPRALSVYLFRHLITNLPSSISYTPFGVSLTSGIYVTALYKVYASYFPWVYTIFIAVLFKSHSIVVSVYYVVILVISIRN